jgi:hypothetical protein
VSIQDYSQPVMKAVFPALDGFGLSVADDGIAAKRMLDVALALLAILFCLPLLAIITLAVALDSRGPVIFCQRRAGRNGQLFGIFKFRSMHVLEDGAEIVQATRGDARITRIGRLLRASSLDELPQLFNVLSGEMSLVGTPWPMTNIIPPASPITPCASRSSRASPAGPRSMACAVPRCNFPTCRPASIWMPGMSRIRASGLICSFLPARRWKSCATGMRSDARALLHPRRF